MSTHPRTHLTEEQYLEIERKAEIKSEYFQGEMFAMAGARATHNLLVARLLGLMYVSLGTRSCRSFPSDMRVRTKSRLYTYPDALVLCDKPEYLDERQDTLLNPGLIVEVLSPSTEAYDRGKKFDLYQSIDSLREYLLISTDRVHVDLYSRQPDGGWRRSSAEGMQGEMELRSIGVRLSLAELYRDIELAPTVRGSEPSPAS
jgi:Uma2 family endonuclease